ncbi:pyrin-like [Onychostoma macrolepis]|uniref:pyrin-like n=1 Tax=Onychostoma macrolepis TaxID=369639 RepID=UPI00272D5CA8|nr:pyrin-like [Onychostoma macrolepis]
MMEEQQKAAEKQEQELIEELEQEITELKMRNTELEQLSHTEDHLHLLQIHSSLCSPRNTRNWPEISMKTHESLETLRRALNQLKDTIDDKLTQTVSTELKWMQQYAVDVTLDPDTAHPELILSDDGKQVRHGDITQRLLDKPERFDPCPCVLGKEGFSSGRFYFEVQVKGKTKWTLGVARESINRKGQITLSPSDGCWTVFLRNGDEYEACDDPRVSLSLRVKLQRVGVFVDYEEGLVSFYDVESSSHIYSFTAQSFTEKLYPYFNPCTNEGGKNSSPLIITPVNGDGPGPLRCSGSDLDLLGMKVLKAAEYAFASLNFSTTVSTEMSLSVTTMAAIDLPIAVAACLVARRAKSVVRRSSATSSGDKP